MELRDYLRILRRHWVVILVMVLVGAGAAATYSVLVTPMYEARTKVFVAATGASSVTELNAGSSFTQQIVRSYAEVVRTGIVLEPVIDDLDLDETPAELATRITASVKLDTVIVEISVTDSDAEQAARIANAVARRLIEAAPELTPTNAGGSDPVRITVAQRAVLPTEPVSPQTSLNIILGAIVGLVLGLAIAVLHTVLDQRIRGAREVAQLTDRPILGAIAYDPKASERPLIVQVDPLSPRSESFRALRTNLQFVGMDGTNRSFVMTSSLELEGKSTTTANLAIALRDSGLSVCVIEGDLRRPKLAEYLGLEGAVGLSDVLIGRVPLQDALQRWGGGNMFVLPAGQRPPNPSELLGSAAMSRVLRQLESEFHIVLIDAPPLLPVTDGAILSKQTSGAILLVAAGRTHRGQFEAALASLEGVGATIHGIVMTMVPTKGPDAYGYGGYGSGGYGYTYQPKVDAPRAV
ncbi:polysaccharide biosynthesis tyrosine autokinase [Homoserinibacter sp. GY 40078]|uniref:polysaccharide biosynthesis tyrosine autokinase n=1 Tax=Homoserinibacter sp. GY 40078 TaxID=2603275 RepID=UPI0011CA18AB|nr:polysaccharide biosynthesis tyrosine autokinase [Homoserinibacter sp. GY 40078]TXK19495.1 polysaccharide biosynthesis tyrosine autokinase [Homoserinibacter sp. GY 40078]